MRYVPASRAVPARRQRKSHRRRPRKRRPRGRPPNGKRADSRSCCEIRIRHGGPQVARIARGRQSSISIAAGLKRSAKAINQRLLLLRRREQWAHKPSRMSKIARCVCMFSQLNRGTTPASYGLVDYNGFGKEPPRISAQRRAYRSFSGSGVALLRGNNILRRNELQ